MAQQDKEIEAMASIAKALEGLESEETGRVLRWAAQRYGGAEVSTFLPGGVRQGSSGAGGGTGIVDGETPAFEEFVDLFDATSPRTEADCALVGGYWFQVVRGNSDFQSQEVNTALKDMGRGVSNITQALGTLEARKPVLVRQVAKSGRTKQARKKYKLTQAGINAVRQMLSGETDEEE